MKYGKKGHKGGGLQKGLTKCEGFTAHKSVFDTTKFSRPKHEGKVTRSVSKQKPS